MKAIKNMKCWSGAGHGGARRSKKAQHDPTRIRIRACSKMASNVYQERCREHVEQEWMKQHEALLAVGDKEPVCSAKKVLASGSMEKEKEHVQHRGEAFSAQSVLASGSVAKKVYVY